MKRTTLRVAPFQGEGKGELLAEVLEVLAGLEPDRAAGRDLHFLARPRVAPDAPLARLDLEDAKPAQLDPLAPHHRVLHGFEDGLDGGLRLDLGDVGGLGNLVDDVHLDHAGSAPSQWYLL